MLGHNETQQLLDLVSERSPKLVEDLVPGKLPVSTVTQVLKNLLQEGVSIRDNRSIFDSLLSESGKTKDAIELTSLIRPHLGRSIVQDIISAGEDLPIITLEQSLEQLLNNALKEGSQSRDAFLEPKLIDALANAIAREKYSVENRAFQRS